jgi:FkbM family methyltransferase
MVGESGKVIAFEPNPQNLQLIYSSIIENQFQNITVYPLAVSDSRQVLRFVTVGSNGGVTTDPSVYGENYQMLVQAMKVDDLLQSEPKIDIIKIDIEAHEFFAIRGMEQTLKKHKPTIFTEFHPWAIRLNYPIEPEEYLKQLINYDYRLSIIEASGNIVSAPNSKFVMSYWQGLKNKLKSDTVHIDLMAEPM